MLHLGGDERALKRYRRIALRAARDDRVAENLANDSPKPPRRFVTLALLYRAQGRQNFRCADIGNW